MRKQKIFCTVIISISIGFSITLFSHHEDGNFQTKMELKNQQFDPNVHKSRNYRPRHHARDRDPRYREISRRKENSDPITWCKPLSFQDHDDQEERTSSRTALVSFPGSGNTWVRYLLQQMSGIMTGSVYDDGVLRNHGFPGEHVADDKVLVVKTHEWGPVIRYIFVHFYPSLHHKLSFRSRYNASVLLIRDPLESILSEYNRRSRGHTGHASSKDFTSGIIIHYT